MSILTVQSLLLSAGFEPGPVDGVWGARTEAALRAALEAAKGRAALAIPPDYFNHLARIESGNRPYVKASTSTASGLYQFIKSTWQHYGGRWGRDTSKAFGGLSPSVEEQLERATAFTLDNAKALAAAGVEITNQTLYAAHFLGSGTALKILAKPAATALKSVLPSAVIRANPFLQNMTVADFRWWLDRKMQA